MPEHGSDWRNIAGELPAPRDDEPQHLREDIVAELQDHLACAMNRELHAVRDEVQARNNVIEKFGNPASIARKLWWDAMKERIMSQRILIGTVVLLAIACLAASGFAWMAVQEGRDVKELVMANSQSMLETNRAMMEKLTSMSVSKPEPVQVVAPDPMDWIPVKAKLVFDKAGGPPAQGFEVSLSGNLFGSENINVKKTSDAQGEVDLGYVRPGKCTLQVYAPWGDRHVREFMVMPATPRTETIVCPSKPIETVDLRFRVNWPNDLREKNLAILLTCNVGLRNLHETSWRVHWPTEAIDLETSIKRQQQWPKPSREAGFLLLEPTNGNDDASYHLVHTSYSGVQLKIRAPDDESEPAQVFAVTSPPALADMAKLPVYALPIEIHQIDTLLTPDDNLAKTIENESRPKEHDLFIFTANWSLHGRSDNLWTIMGHWKGKTAPTQMGPGRSIPDQLEIGAKPVQFVPQLGEKNVWTIELPESLIARTREALKAIDEFKAEHASAVETSGGE